MGEIIKKKNVLIVAAVFPPEPVVSANLLYDLATELSKSYNVVVLRPKPTRPAGFHFDNYDNSSFPFKVIEMNSYVYPKSGLWGRFKESLSSGRQASKYIRKHHSSIDFIYNDPWQLFGVNIVARTAVKYGIPYVMAVQDIYPESLYAKLPKIKCLEMILKNILLPIDRFNEKNAAKVHTISDKMVKILSESRGLEKNHYINVRNWQDESKFLEFNNEEVIKDYDGITFMYVGNVGPLAGLDGVLSAFKCAAIPKARFVIAGTGSAKDNLKRKCELEKIAHVEFWDVPNGCVPSVQALSDVMILPVKRGFAMSSIPSKLPAYMFSAKPIIGAVDLESESAKCIVDADAGWVIQPEDIDIMTKTMIDVASKSHTELKKKGINGRNFALKYLSRKGNLPVLVNAIKQIIE